MECRGLVVGVFVVIAASFGGSEPLHAEDDAACKSVRECAEKMVMMANSLKDENAELAGEVARLSKSVKELRAQIEENEKSVEGLGKTIGGLGVEYHCNFSNSNDTRVVRNGGDCTLNNAHNPVQGFWVKVIGK